MFRCEWVHVVIGGEGGTVDLLELLGEVFFSVFTSRRFIIDGCQDEVHRKEGGCLEGNM